MIQVPMPLFFFSDVGESACDDVSGLVQGIRVNYEHLVVLAQEQARPTDVDGSFLKKKNKN